MELKSIKQVVKFKASPHDVYEALMDPKKHSEFTQSKAVIDREVGGGFSVYDGDLRGKNIALIPDRKIVQKWQCVMDGWPADLFSKATFSITKTKEGAKLVFTQTGIPAECLDEIAQGWIDFYWEPMRKMLEG